MTPLELAKQNQARAEKSLAFCNFALTFSIGALMFNLLVFCWHVGFLSPFGFFPAK